jgi:hypothetical protein
VRGVWEDAAEVVRVGVGRAVQHWEDRPGGGGGLGGWPSSADHDGDNPSLVVGSVPGVRLTARPGVAVAPEDRATDGQLRRAPDRRLRGKLVAVTTILEPNAPVSVAARWQALARFAAGLEKARYRVNLCGRQSSLA